MYPPLIVVVLTVNSSPGSNHGGGGSFFATSVTERWIVPRLNPGLSSGTGSGLGGVTGLGGEGGAGGADGEGGDGGGGGDDPRFRKDAPRTGAGGGAGCPGTCAGVGGGGAFPPNAFAAITPVAMPFSRPPLRSSGISDGRNFVTKLTGKIPSLCERKRPLTTLPFDQLSSTSSVISIISFGSNERSPSSSPLNSSFARAKVFPPPVTPCAITPELPL
mmetsp:Transcript_4226/g.6198  ORF Transcript_4226/g.6198 Transcript_4226/m.6198 type:complete len:218 (+) Transcript_4226:982-1635(+)